MVGIIMLLIGIMGMAISSRAIWAASVAGVLGILMLWPATMRDGFGMLL